MKAYKCECGSDSFLRTYTLYQEEVKVTIDEKIDLVFVEELGNTKSSVDGYTCAKCDKEAEELNEWI